jgi:hypothetical protein
MTTYATVIRATPEQLNQTREIQTGTSILLVDGIGRKISERDTRDWDYSTHGPQGIRKCPTKTHQRLWTKARIETDCSLVQNHEGNHLTNPLPLYINGNHGRINFTKGFIRCVVCTGIHNAEDVHGL